MARKHKEQSTVVERSTENRHPDLLFQSIKHHTLICMSIQKTSMLNSTAKTFDSPCIHVCNHADVVPQNGSRVNAIHSTHVKDIEIHSTKNPRKMGRFS